MKQVFLSLLLTSFSMFALQAIAQGSLLDEMSTPADSTPAEPEEFPNTFETVRLVNGHSTEMPGARAMQFMITHRFGAINSGPYDLFGLDQANMRLGFDIGITDRIAIGIGRSNNFKTYDTHLKLKLLKQSENMPVSLVGISTMALKGTKWDKPNHVNNYFTHRLTFTHQLLVAKRFGEHLALQVMPTMVHRNLSPLGEQNDVFICGVGGSFKLNSRNAINVEFYPFVANKPTGYTPSLALGWDLETGGHVFQITLANSQYMADNLFLTQATGNWLDGGIHLGFNLMRFFDI